MGKKGILGDIEITPKEMQDALHANADGGDPNYIGLNDDTLNLGEAKSFVDEGDANRVFTIRFHNGTDTTQKIQFNKILEDAANHALLKEGHVVTTGASGSEKYLDAEGDPRSLDVLLELIKHTPIRVRSIIFNVSDASQLGEPLKYRKETPFMTGSTEQIIPSNFQNQNTNNTKTVEVSLKKWILGYDSTILYAIRSGVSVDMTISFGASFDPANALRKKYDAAVIAAAKYFARTQQA